MKLRVLIVDDSGFFRRRLGEILASDPIIEVVGMAADGQQAIEKVRELKPDVVTMDIEMPVMDGITATRRIMAQNPVAILMFSSLTTDGAKATLDALDAGAIDFLPKRFDDISKDREQAKKVLCERVKTVGKSKFSIKKSSPVIRKPAIEKNVVAKPFIPRRTNKHNKVKLLAIGTSTGGPLALQKVLSRLPENFSVPVILVQHMPSTFTPAFAERMNKLCAITIKHAVSGDVLQAGTAYLAPGGQQMKLGGSSSKPVLHVEDGDPSLTYKPSVDVTFSSIANIFPSETLAIIMTGMGSDGRDGSIILKNKGSTIWAQDEDSCVVYGMPAAVAESGILERVITLDDIGQNIMQWI